MKTWAINIHFHRHFHCSYFDDDDFMLFISLMSFHLFQIYKDLFISDIRSSKILKEPNQGILLRIILFYQQLFSNNLYSCKLFYRFVDIKGN